MVRFENLPRPEKGGPKNGLKKGPSTNRLLEAWAARPGKFGQCLAECADGIWLLNSKIPCYCLARPAPRRGRRIQVQSFRALRQAREEGFQQKSKVHRTISLQINGNYIQVVSGGACDRKGTLEGSHFEPQVGRPNAPKSFQDTPLTTLGSLKNEGRGKKRRRLSTKKRKHGTM